MGPGNCTESEKETTGMGVLDNSPGVEILDNSFGMGVLDNPPGMMVLDNSPGVGVSDNYPDADKDEISRKVKRSILDNFMYGYDDSQLSYDTSFLKIGVLDSTGIMELIELVERDFEVEVRDSEILPENFDSVNCISRYISRKLNERRLCRLDDM